jgi:hypothetical protein
MRFDLSLECRTGQIGPEMEMHLKPTVVVSDDWKEEYQETSVCVHVS